MKLSSPLLITPRLLPGVQISDSWISISHYSRRDGRSMYQYFIDTPEFEHEGHDITVRIGHEQRALSTLISFLSVAAESYHSVLVGRQSENADLFPKNVMEWAYQHSDEISLLDCELNEKELIEYDTES